MDTFETGQDSAPEVGNTDQSVENSPQTAEVQTGESQEQFSGHPAWKTFEEALGPIHYRSIEPHLRSMSQAFESKIAATNKALEPWKSFAEEGIDPEELKFARQLAQEINTQPLEFYQKLETYLRQTGQLEAAAQVAQAADAAAGAEGEDPDEDPQIAALKAQIEQLSEGQQQWLQLQQAQMQEQQHRQQVEAESTKLESEVQALKQAGADDRMIKAVIDRAELEYFRTGKPTPLTEIHKQVQAEYNSIRNQPQAVDRAPRLPSVTGGAPSQGSTDLSTASRSQSIDTLAELIRSASGR